jgi:ribonuclease HII
MDLRAYAMLADEWRLPPTLRTEFLDRKPILVVAADEVGYGAWAGPYTVCAVVASIGWRIDGLRDSKKISKKKRPEVDKDLRECAALGDIDFRIASVDNTLIDLLGAARALRNAFRMALHKLFEAPMLQGLGERDYFIILDGEQSVPELKTFAMPKADDSVPAAMAASILAKVHRDGVMRFLHQQHTYFDWANNVGYGSAKHQSALASYGVSKYHRRSYAPIRRLLQNEE